VTRRIYVDPRSLAEKQPAVVVERDGAVGRCRQMEIRGPSRILCDPNKQGVRLWIETEAEIAMDDENSTAQADQPSPADEIVDRWFNDVVHNSPASRDTQVFNHLLAAMAELKKRLRAAQRA
jgi:hypothetical protein